MNELISNTLKHAFPGEAEGEISLSMREEDDRIVMRFQDTGVGFPETLDFRNTQSLGLQLVNILVEQINGTIELIANGGTTFTITFPITSGKEALESVQRDRPALILMDIVLEGKMDGIQVAAQIQSSFDIPVVYLTAYTDEETLKGQRSPGLSAMCSSLSRQRIFRLPLNWRYTSTG